jgi:putative tryptophan/tyrosine transport system substrate-binding protein
VRHFFAHVAGKARFPGMDRRRFLLTLLAGTLAAPLAAGAQQAVRVYRIGVLSTIAVTDISGPNPTNPHMRTLLQRLGELGWVYGQNLITEPRGADGKLERFPALAGELVRAGVDVIVTVGGNPAALAAKQATSAIPVVMASSADPVGTGIVPHLARPGGNITGMTVDAGPEIYMKRLELLKSAAPGVSRVGVISRAGGMGQPWHRLLRTSADALNVALVDVQVASPEDFPAAFAILRRERVDALLVSDASLNYHHRRLITDFASSHRLPTVYAFREAVETGGLMGLGVDILDVYRRAAGYVDKILRGASPADLPVEQPTKFELVINLKTAKALGLTIPPSLLAQADQVIE